MKKTIKKYSKIIKFIILSIFLTSCNLVESGEISAGKKNIDQKTDNRTYQEKEDKDMLCISFDNQEVVIIPGSKSGIKVKRNGDLVRADFDVNESERIYNELNEEKIDAQKSTAYFLGFKHLSKEQYKALKEAQKDKRDEYGLPVAWTAYKELLAIGEIEPIRKRMTLDEVKKIVESTDSFEETETIFAERQPVADRFNYGGNTIIKEYWIDDEGKEVIEVFAGYIDPERWGSKSITYKKSELIDGVLKKSESQILAKYDPENKKKDDSEEEFEYKNNKTPKFEPRYDNEESEKIYNELDEEQRNAQKDTKAYVGYKRLTDEQYKALSDIDKESGDTEKKLILKKLAAIGEADPNRRLTLEHVKSVISGIDDIGSYQYSDVILMISEELIKEKYYPDIFQKYYFDEEINNITLKNESSQAWYWLDDKGSECIVITFGKSVVYGKMNNGELEVLETLYEKKVEQE